MLLQHKINENRQKRNRIIKQRTQKKNVKYRLNNYTERTAD